MPLPTRRPGLPRRGFSIIELMIVVAIIGLLASIAIPQFQLLSLRAKRGERDAMITSIMRVLNDHWREHGKLPGGGLSLATNPPHPADGSRQRFDHTLDGWKSMGFQPDGLLYFRYEVAATMNGGTGSLFVTATTDLDKDGVQNVKTVTFSLRDGSWQWSGEEELGDDY